MSVTRCIGQNRLMTQVDTVEIADRDEAPDGQWILHGALRSESRPKQQMVRGWSVDGARAVG